MTAAPPYGGRAAPPVQPGDVLAGKFRVERVLGVGGMGVVVAAMHLQLNQRVALKFLLPDVLKSPELVARFHREAQSTTRIKSEHVVRVIDVGTLESGAPYMVMEFLEGQDLAQLIKQRGGLPGQEAIEYLLQACEALAEAHMLGIVHRDLKPANLFLTQHADGTPLIKVLDFGISKAVLEDEAPGQGLTQTQAVMGSPQYMSPEQLKSSRSVDGRSDVWALGIILHELLTGETAFRADTIPQLYVAILSERPPPLRMRRPDAPAGVEAIILRCLEKDPLHRFADIAAFATALGEFAPTRARPSIERVQRIVGNKASSNPRLPTPPASMPVASPHAASVAYNPNVPPTQPAGVYPTHVPIQQQTYAPQGQSYAQQPGYGMPQPPMPMYAQQAAPPPQPQGMSTATIVLIVLVTLIVIGGGGCMMCVCIGAASQ
jgi:serine/threonine-protein kinase